MADDKESDTVNWYMPERRAIIPLDDYNVPRSLRKYMETMEFKVLYDKDSPTVIQRCAEREETWISQKLINSYMELLRLGHIHSVEVYDGRKLVGGLYGVTFRGAFFGESMFSKVSQASKVALIKLIEHLNQQGFKLLDVQIMTEHLRMFGAVEIELDEYQALLEEAYTINCEF